MTNASFVYSVVNFLLCSYFVFSMKESNSFTYCVVYSGMFYPPGESALLVSLRYHGDLWNEALVNGSRWEGKGAGLQKEQNQSGGPARLHESDVVVLRSEVELSL